jgi:hypothetical protein
MNIHSLEKTVRHKATKDYIGVTLFVGEKGHTGQGSVLKFKPGVWSIIL